MKRKVIPVLIGLLLIVLILAGAAGVFLFQRYSGSKEEADLNAYFGLNGSQEVAIVWNQELTEEKGLLQDERCYLKLDTVHEMLNERFYVDHNEKLLLYTLPEETVQIGIGEQTADGYTAAVEQNGDVWLALDYVKQYSDFNYALYTEPNRVVLTTNWDTLQSAELKKNTALRVRGGVKSEVLQNLEKGTKVTVLEEMENWDQVQTQDGYIGYVQKKHVTDPAEETPVKDTGYVEPDYTGNLRDHKIDLAWHQVTVESANSTFPGVMSGVTGVNVISPTWYSLYDNTGVVDGIASPSYVQQAHALGLEVWALIDDFTHREDNGVDPQEILSYTSKRTAIIEVLMSEADRCGFDGINVDFEKVTEDGSQDYIQFIRELSVACRQKGLVLSVDNYVPHNYNAHYKWAEQGVMADYVIIMGYDEHYNGSAPGSVASLGYVRDGIENTLKLVPREKVILGVPFYTRVWTETDEGVKSSALGIEEAKAWIEANHVDLYWQKELGQYYGELPLENGIKMVWMEDEESLKLKMNLARENDLAGVACWKLGLEDEEAWTAIGWD